MKSITLIPRIAEKGNVRTLNNYRCVINESDYSFHIIPLYSVKIYLCNQMQLGRLTCYLSCQIKDPNQLRPNNLDHLAYK